VNRHICFFAIIHRFPHLFFVLLFRHRARIESLKPAVALQRWLLRDGEARDVYGSKTRGHVIVRSDINPYPSRPAIWKGNR
jgi:hypothetical protein